MIYESLVVPSESPTSIREIKRALLAYDKVYLVDPSDRDLIPGSTYMAAATGIPFFSLPVKSVRLMGKTIGYDDVFERIVDQCLSAINQDLIEVISTYDQSETQDMVIGSVQIGGFPLDPSSVLYLYRGICENQSILSSALDAHEMRQLFERSDLLEDLAIAGVADGTMNNTPPLQPIDNHAIPEEHRENLSLVARARIASLVKYSCYCEMKNLVPVFPSNIYGNMITKLLSNTREVLSLVEDDQYWLNRNRVLDICHEEFMVDEMLDSLSIDQVLKLRTSVWGEHAVERERLFETITSIAQECPNNQQFLTAVRGEVSEYAKLSKALERERSALHFNVKCNLATTALGAGSTPELIGQLSQYQSPLASIATTLAIGGTWAIHMVKEFVPALKQIKERESVLSRGAGVGIHNFYRNIGN